MKVLLLAQFLPPVSGGEERHVATLAGALAARDHEVTLLAFATGIDGPDVTTSDGVRIVRVPTAASRLPGLYQDLSRPFALPLPDPLVSRAIRNELARGGFDVVHAHNWIVNSALGPAARAHVPVVMTVHDYSHTCATKRLMEHGKERCAGPSFARCVSCASSYYGGAVRGGVVVTANAWSARRRDHHVLRFAAVSSFVAAALRDNPPWLPGANPTVEVIPNFIRDDIVVDDIPPMDEGAPIVYVGALCVDKGVQPLLDAYQLLDSPTPMVLAGHAWPGTSYQFPDGAQWVGQQPYDAILGLFQSARLVVVPSVWAEPCPTVVLEAMAAGRPVVGAASGGIIDMVVDGVTGFLVPPGDISGLAKAMATLLSNPELAQEFGQAGRDRVRDFTISAVVERIERMYASAIEEADHRTAPS